MTQTKKKKPADSQRKPHGVAALWKLWMDNLRQWLFYIEEYAPHDPLNIPHWLRKTRKKLNKFFHALRRDLRHQNRETRRRHFPESEYPLAQLCLFFAGSLPRMGAAVTEVFSLRRLKKVSGSSKGSSHEKRLHPVAFLGVALVAVAICAALSFYTVGTTAVYDGTSLGTVSGFNAVSAVVEDVTSITREALGNSSYDVDESKLETSIDVVPRSEVESKETLAQNLSDELGLVEYGYTLYIDEEPIAATIYAGALEELLDQLTRSYITADTVDCYFDENVSIREGYVDAGKVMNLGKIAEILNETKAGEVTYTVESGDSYYYIAELYGMTLDDLMDMNPGYDIDLLRVGDVLTISHAVPYLTVVNVERQRYVSDVPFAVEYEDDNSMYQGDYKVLSAGEYGKADVTVNVTYVNGTETSRQTVASVTLSEPVTELQARGTIPRPSWFPTGSFRWPCYGTLTSYFGYRHAPTRGASTNHGAIDIANGYGTPIYASDGGTVIVSGWQGGLGYAVTIDHGNGFQTIYGHNSSLLVKAGDHVYKGQQIARMGSTGISTGSHCHFAVKYYGTYVDPLDYL
ncbi:MAG: M23 family metallopeptidase [Oscillospiraceae bacterium]|nr:M23 family metallopeptidase [Oscillospiraceae bacterium]